MHNPRVYVVVVQSLSPVHLFITPWTVAHPAPLSSTISQSSLRFMSMRLVMVSNHFIPCRPHFLLPSIFPSIRVFSSESALHIRWPKYWSSSFKTVSLMNIQGQFPLGLTGLISLQVEEPSSVFSAPQFKKHQFFSAWPSLWSNSHNPTRLPEKP